MQETSTGHQSRSKHSDKAVVWVDDLRSVPKREQPISRAEAGASGLG